MQYNYSFKKRANLLEIFSLFYQYKKIFIPVLSERFVHKTFNRAKQIYTS